MTTSLILIAKVPPCGRAGTIRTPRRQAIRTPEAVTNRVTSPVTRTLANP